MWSRSATFSRRLSVCSSSCVAWSASSSAWCPSSVAWSSTCRWRVAASSAFCWSPAVSRRMATNATLSELSAISNAIQSRTLCVLRRWRRSCRSSASRPWKGCAIASKASVPARARSRVSGAPAKAGVATVVSQASRPVRMLSMRAVCWASCATESRRATSSVRAVVARAARCRAFAPSIPGLSSRPRTAASAFQTASWASDAITRMLLARVTCAVVDRSSANAAVTTIPMTTTALTARNRQRLRARTSTSFAMSEAGCAMRAQGVRSADCVVWKLIRQKDSISERPAIITV